MDSALKTLVMVSARNFLSTSQKLEPYIPNSHQNITYALKWLGSLGRITQLSLGGTKTLPQSFWTRRKRDSR